MNKVKIGLVVDFRNYKNYYKKFNEKYENKILEFHILEKDLEQNFADKLNELKKFIKSQRIEDIAFHSPDRLMQSVLFDEHTSYLNEDKKKFFFLLDELKKLSNGLNQEILLVVHQGIKLPKGFFDGMSTSDIDTFKMNCLKKAEESYEMMLKYTKDSGLLPVLENSPPFCACEDSEHFLDLAFEDIENRLKKRRGFVFDFSHAAMCIEYFKQSKLRCEGLESLRRVHKGIPKSLLSMENYILKAGKNIAWIHISDANGVLGENEGLAVGANGSLIDFTKLIALIQKEIRSPKGVLEIIGAHRNYKLIDGSMEKLEKIRKNI